MVYSNAPEPEGINAQDGRGEGREFILLLFVLIVCAVVASFLFLRVGMLIGPLVPFSWEQRFAPTAAFAVLDNNDTSTRLQHLADRLVRVMDVPDHMQVTVHYSPQPVVNAIATFGGHIVLFEGLLSQLESEDAIAALLAHEIAHVRDRHVIKGATGRVLLNVAWASLGLGTDMAGNLASLGGLNQLQALASTRSMEREADAQALDAVIALYGHAGGYFDLFETLGALLEQGAASFPNILSSHPKVTDRMDAARAKVPASAQHGARTPWAAPTAQKPS